MTQDLVSSLCEELSRRYRSMVEDAVCRAITTAEGYIPQPASCAAHGLFVRGMQGSDSYEEFRWRGKPMFQIRLRFQDLKAVIEVTHL